MKLYRQKIIQIFDIFFLLIDFKQQSFKEMKHFSGQFWLWSASARFRCTFKPLDHHCTKTPIHSVHTESAFKKKKIYEYINQAIDSSDYFRCGKQLTNGERREKPSGILMGSLDVFFSKEITFIPLSVSFFFILIF